MTDPELWKMLQQMKVGLVSLETTLKHFGVSREDVRQAIQNIELLGRIHAAKN
ncbi:hypothetical protein LCGC14_0378900 [marine sediment metagenome]|uniref:Uncharacterized protein n=1 Tax=marine sediment metagenome TaxID=412755 RepID=A0A0F9TL52_9ZZZZ